MSFLIHFKAFLCMDSSFLTIILDDGRQMIGQCWRLTVPVSKWYVLLRRPRRLFALLYNELACSVKFKVLLIIIPRSFSEYQHNLELQSPFCRKIVCREVHWCEEGYIYTLVLDTSKTLHLEGWNFILFFTAQSKR